MHIIKTDQMPNHRPQKIKLSRFVKGTDEAAGETDIPENT